MPALKFGSGNPRRGRLRRRVQAEPNLAIRLAGRLGKLTDLASA